MAIFALLVCPTLKFFNSLFNWGGWDAISAIAVSITVFYIYIQSKYLKYQAMPIAWFFLISPKTFNPGSINDKRNWLFVKNDSKYITLLYYKVIGPRVDDGKKTLPFTGTWDAPLHVYPGLMQYPSVIPELTQNLLSEAMSQNRDIRIDIHYGLAPEYAPEEIERRTPATWRFDIVQEIWVGPNGMPDTGFLPLILRK